MSSYFVAETLLSRVRPVDAGLRPSLYELKQALQRHLEPDEAAEIAEAFSDPVAGEGRAAIDWYTDRPEDTIAVSELPPEEASAVLEAVGALRARLRDVVDTLRESGGHPQDAKILTAAVNVPSNERYIYSSGGKPVLVAWGYQLAEAGALPVPAGKWVERKPAVQNERDRGKGAAEVGTVLASGPVAAAAGPFPLLALVLWLLFLGLVLAIAYVLLTACSIGYPHLSLTQRGLNILNRCPVPVVSAAIQIEQETDREAALRNAIRDAELAVARDAQGCRVERIREAELAPPPPVVEEPPVGEARRPEEPQPERDRNEEAEEALERVRDAGGQEGEFQIILEWDGPADLDLYIDCEGGGIAYNRRQNCAGGTLDVDANHEVNMDQPVENVHWGTNPPPGDYGIRVRNAKSQGDNRPQTPFKVHVRRGNEVETYEGAIGPRESVDVTRLTIE